MINYESELLKEAQIRSRIAPQLQAFEKRINEVNCPKQLIKEALKQRKILLRQRRFIEWMAGCYVGTSAAETPDLLPEDLLSIVRLKYTLDGHSVEVLRQSAIAEARAYHRWTVENQGVML